jgi:hypothetical protein
VSDATDLTFAALTAAALLASGESVSDVVAAFQAAEVMTEEQAPASTQFIARLSDTRDERALFARRLTRAVLPSFKNVRSVVDLRAGFKEEDIAFLVPVLVTRIRTDTEEELTFQLDTSQLRSLIGELQQVLKRMEAAEQLGSKLRPE